MIVDVNSIDYNTTDLCQIMANHGSDKALGWHNYTLVYSILFEKFRNSSINFFELGIGVINSGASLRGWKEYFVKANIYGADILDEALFTEHRIQTYQCDQLDKKSIESLWSNFKRTEFDVILEDGLHNYEANIHFFENSFHKVKKGGFYIIEDVLISALPEYQKYFEQCTFKMSDIQILPLHNPGNNFDNALVIIKK